MIIISTYQILPLNQKQLLCVSKENNLICPCCGHSLIYRDSRFRIVRLTDGKKYQLLVRRLKCSYCHKLHTEIPNILQPYKHYPIQIMQSFIKNDTMALSHWDGDFPSEETVKRWKHG